MSATPEYSTLISLTAELRHAVQSNLVSLSDSLKAEFLISPENASQLRNPMHPEADRAAKLVDIIQNKVIQNPHHYHTFVRVLESQGRDYYSDILSRLSVVYQEHGGTSQQPVLLFHPVPHSQAPGPIKEYSDIKQRNIHRIEPDDDNGGIKINSGSRLSRQDSQSNSTVHTSQLWCYLLSGGGVALLVGVVLVFYSYGPWQSGNHQQDCTKIESPRVLFQELREIGPWEHLCQNLGVSTPTMESLKHDSAQNTEKKRHCLKAFYDEDTEPGVQVCWETVLKAVSSFPISNQKLAKKIANKYSINIAIIDP